MKEQTKKSEGLGFWTLVFMGLGTVIGAGVVTYIGVAVGMTGRSAWLAYGVAVVLGLLCNLPLILLSTAARINGGNYSFMATTLGDTLGGYYGISQVLMPLSFSTFSLSLGTYLNVVFPSVPVKIFAYVGLIVFAVLNLFGTNFIAKIQNVMSILLIAGLLIFGIYGFLHPMEGSFDFGAQGYFSNGLDGFWQAVMILMSSTTGYTFITAFSGVSRKPKTELPLAMAIIPVFLLVLYCSVGFTMSNVIPVSETANQPLTVVAKLIFNPAIYLIFVFTGPVMALCTTINSSFSIFEKPLVQATKDGWLPKTLSETNKYGISWKYMIIFFLVGIIPMLCNFSISTIVSNTTFINSIGYILVIIGVMRYPKTMDGAWENRSLKLPMWLFQLACCVALLIRCYMMWRSLKTANMTMIVGSILVSVLFLAWCYFRRKTGKVQVTKSWQLQ